MTGAAAWIERYGRGRRRVVDDDERPEDGELTLPGCLLVRFDDDGGCEELREYWHVQHGVLEPPDGWGA